MGVRYRYEFHDMKNTLYRVDLLEDGYSSTITTLTTLMDQGFTLTYDGDGSRVGENPVRGSKAVIHLPVTGSTLESWLDTLAQSSERKYHVVIYRNSILWWCGTVLPDLCAFENRYYPYQFDLTAVDGLSLLNDYDFTYATNPANSDTPTLGTIVTEALKPNGLHTLFGASDVYIRASIEFRESNMNTTARDPLQYIRAKRGAFLKNEDKTDLPSQWEPITCREALEKVLRSLGARIEFSRGSYRIFQHVNYNGTSYTEYHYSKTGVTSGGYLTSATINPQTGSAWQSADLKIEAGSQWTYQPALREAVATYPRRKVYALTQDTFTTGTVAADLGDINTTIPWRITGRAYIEASTFASRLRVQVYRYNTATNLVTHLVILNEDQGVNDFYEEPGAVKWYQLGTPTANISGLGFGYNIPANFVGAIGGKVQVDVNITIPPTAINLGDDIRIRITAESTEPIYVNGRVTTGNNLWNSIDWQGQLAMEGMVDTSASEWTDVQEAVATNTDLPDNSASLEIQDVLTDEDALFTEAVEILNNSSAWVSANAWRPYTGYTGTLQPLASTLAGYVMGHHWQPVKVLRATFRDLEGFLFDTVSAPNNGGEVYVWNGGSFSANDAQWSGEWLRYQWDESAFSTAVRLPSARDKAGTTEKDIKSLRQRIGDIGNVAGGTVSRFRDGMMNGDTGGHIGTVTGGDIYRPVFIFDPTQQTFKALIEPMYTADGFTTLTGTTTLSKLARTVFCDLTGGGFTVTLPPVADFLPGTELVIMKTDNSANTLTIDGNGTETINGNATRTTNTQFNGWTLIAFGGNWIIKP